MSKNFPRSQRIQQASLPDNLPLSMLTARVSAMVSADRPGAEAFQGTTTVASLFLINTASQLPKFNITWVFPIALHPPDGLVKQRHEALLKIYTPLSSPKLCVDQVDYLPHILTRRYRKFSGSTPAF